MPSTGTALKRAYICGLSLWWMRRLLSPLTLPPFCSVLCSNRSRICGEEGRHGKVRVHMSVRARRLINCVCDMRPSYTKRLWGPVWPYARHAFSLPFVCGDFLLCGTALSELLALPLLCRAPVFPTRVVLPYARHAISLPFVCGKFSYGVPSEMLARSPSAVLCVQISERRAHRPTMM